MTPIKFAQINEIVLTAHMLLHDHRHLTKMLLKPTCVKLKELLFLAVAMVGVVIDNVSKTLTQYVWHLLFFFLVLLFSAVYFFKELVLNVFLAGTAFYDLFGSLGRL